MIRVVLYIMFTRAAGEVMGNGLGRTIGGITRPSPPHPTVRQGQPPLPRPPPQ